MGAPAEWTVLEAGAGTGSLAEQILSAAPRFSAPFAGALSYQIVEPDARARRLQQQHLAGHATRVCWVPGIR